MDLKIEKIFSWVLFLLFVFLFLATWSYGAKARLAPLFMLVPGIILTGIHLGRIHRQPDLIKGEGVAEEDGESFEINAPFDQEMCMVVWFIAFAALIWLIGFLIATPLFLILYLRLWAKEKWRLTLSLAVITTLCIYLIVEWAFKIILYRGWISSVIE
jgi:hypothetical protein